MTLNDPASQDIPVAAAYGAAAGVRRPRRLLRWVLLGFGGAILLGGSCIGGFYLLMKRGQAEVEPVADVFLATLSRKDYKGAYKLFTTEARNAISEEDCEWFEATFDKVLGPLKARNLTGFRVSKDTAGATAVIVYDATFANGPGTITITLQKIGGAWVVHGYRADSPLIIKLLTCARCKKKSNGLFRFCPSCGNEVSVTVP
jgi:hypothetical protein